MKRIAVVTSDVPFVEGGHLVLARSAVRALREAGHEAGLVLTPQNRFGRQFQAYLATRLTDVGLDGLDRPIDQVISMRFPSYAVKHPVHVCWLNHRLREYYDLWPALRAQLRPAGRLKEGLRRRLIHVLDTYLLKHNVRKVYALSGTVQARLRRWGRIPAEVLYPPPPQRAYRTDGYEPFIFTVSRLQKIKRLDLLIEAFRLVKNKAVRAVIIGQGPEREALQTRIREYGLDGRITLLGGTDEAAVVDHYARCRAVFFCPYNEDYGFVTPEAFASGKAVLTSLDSGGPAEIVRDGETGYVVEPAPEAVAAKIDLLADDPGAAERLGRNALAASASFSWETTVRRLTLEA
ncbi:MAG: glycosyltransferase family 4 protein [Candidatus Aminicenantes bacterium]|nr:glycosyltransferase family 4 protein [Candidatus Aminicenantes bacterium]